MTQKQHKGVWLRLEQSSQTAMSVLTPILCGAFLFSMGVQWGDTMPWLPAGAGMFVCGGYLLLRKKEWFVPVCLGAMVLVLILFRERITDGFAQVYNRIGDAYTAGTGIVLPALETQGDGCVLFSILFGAVVGLSFCLLSGSAVLSGLAALLCAGSSVLFGTEAILLPLVLCAVVLCVPRRCRVRTLLMPLAVLCGLLLLSQIPGVQTWTKQQSAVLRAQIHAACYETAYTTLPEGDLSNGALPRSDAPALVVTMEKPEELYLRGFTGVVLEGERWKPLDTKILAEHEDLLYWLNLKEFDIRAQFEAAAAVMETEKNTVTVQNIGACSSFRYIPFGIRADEKLKPEDLADNARGAGERYNIFTTVYDAPALLRQLPETLVQSDDPQVRRYLQAESAYREFVRETYMTVPADTQLLEYWQAAEKLEPQEAVRAVLAQCFPEGAENSPAYATAAVLTLRHFGIPARYAEGYIVPESADTSIEVTGSHAACWAEVYHDGIGWLPMAMTPGLEAEEQEENFDKPEPTETVPEETQPQSEPDPSGGTQVRIEKLLLSWLAIVLLLVLLTVLVLVLRRRWILNRRKVLLEQGDIREAVAWSMADAVSILAQLGIHRGKGSLEAMSESIRERFGGDYALQFRTAAWLNAKAIFSSREMDEAERKTVLDFRTQTLERLKADANWIKKLWMQFVLCLY